MNVYLEKNTEHNRWWVHMDEWQVSFKTSAEAEAFVARLTARLNAPHSRSKLAGWPLHPGLCAVGITNAQVATDAELRCAQEAC